MSVSGLGNSGNDSPRNNYVPLTPEQVRERDAARPLSPQQAELHRLLTLDPPVVLIACHSAYLRGGTAIYDETGEIVDAELDYCCTCWRDQKYGTCRSVG